MTVAIIGHGPSLQNSNKGKLIDSFEYVVRFPYINNWQKPKDYGNKTSFFCATVGRRKRCPEQKSEYGYCIWSKNQNPIPERFSEDINVTDLIAYWQNYLIKYPYFSHGTAGICIAAAVIKEPITVFGCDNLKTGTSGKYIGAWNYEGRYRRNIGHALDEERDIIDEISKFYNVKIKFD